MKPDPSRDPALEHFTTAWARALACHVQGRLGPQSPSPEEVLSDGAREASYLRRGAIRRLLGDALRDPATVQLVPAVLLAWQDAPSRVRDVVREDLEIGASSVLASALEEDTEGSLNRAWKLLSAFMGADAPWDLVLNRMPTTIDEDDLWAHLLDLAVERLPNDHRLRDFKLAAAIIAESWLRHVAHHDPEKHAEYLRTRTEHLVLPYFTGFQELPSELPAKDTQTGQEKRSVPQPRPSPTSASCPKTRSHGEHLLISHSVDETRPPVPAPERKAIDRRAPTWFTGDVRRGIQELYACMEPSMVELSFRLETRAMRSVRGSAASTSYELTADGLIHFVQRELSQGVVLTADVREGSPRSQLWYFETDIDGRLTSSRVYEIGYNPIDYDPIVFNEMTPEEGPRVMWFVEGSLCPQEFVEGRKLETDLLAQARIVALVPYFMPPGKTDP